MSDSEREICSNPSQMQHLGGGNGTRNMKRRYLIGGSIAVVALIVVVVILVVCLVVQRHKETFRDTFVEKCGKFKNHDECQQIFTVFEQAYVGKSSCDVPMEAYDPLMATVPFDYPCNKTMLWSDTYELVHKYTSKNTDCFTLEDTLLGHTLDRLTWCGERGNQETLTEVCPGWNQCVNNPVRSFWDRASLGFARHACGEVTVMLNGAREQPFDPDSTLARMEIKNLQFPRVTQLTVILVTRHRSKCSSGSLNELQNHLDPRITTACKEVPESVIEKCSSNTNKGCAACLLMMT